MILLVFGLVHGTPIKRGALGRIITLGYATLVRVKLVMLTPGNWESQMAVERAPALLSTEPLMGGATLGCHLPDTITLLASRSIGCSYNQWCGTAPLFHSPCLHSWRIGWVAMHTAIVCWCTEMFSSTVLSPHSSNTSLNPR